MCPFDDDVVLVPVRVDRLDAVLKARDGGDLGAYDAKVEGPAGTFYGPKKDWRGEDLRQLYEVSRPNMRLVLDHIAQQPPNRRVPLRELSEAVYGNENDPNLSRISGVFNGLTGNSRKIRGKSGGVWPISYDPNGSSGGFEYWMDAATAEKFREIGRYFRQ